MLEWGGSECLMGSEFLFKMMKSSGNGQNDSCINANGSNRQNDSCITANGSNATKLYLKMLKMVNSIVFTVHQIKKKNTI